MAVEVQEDDIFFTFSSFHETESLWHQFSFQVSARKTNKCTRRAAAAPHREELSSVFIYLFLLVFS